MQAAHAGIEYAFSYGRPKDHHPSYIHLTIKNRSQLEKLRFDLNQRGIPTSEFHEPYCEWGLTAIACLLDENSRYVLNHLQLWKTNNDQS